MSYEDGLAALRLEPTSVVPRTEYSIESHWELVHAVTGMDTSEGADRAAASSAFRKAWDYGFVWSINQAYKLGVTTDMGHAVYQADGSDYRPQAKCPFDDVEQVLSFDPEAVFEHPTRAEIVQRFTKQWEAQQRETPHAVVTFGIYDTMFSGLISIFGWEMLLLGAGTDAKRFGEMAGRYARWIGRYFEAAADVDAPAFMCHDDICWTSGPVLAPAWYREFVFPHYKRFWQPILDSGKRLVFTSDGDYTLFFDDVVAAGAQVLVMEPSCDMAGFAAKYGRTHGFVGNADTRILLSGTRERIRAEVQRCMDIGKGCPGFIMAVGNHIPANTPVENALYYNECYMKMRRR